MNTLRSIVTTLAISCLLATTALAGEIPGVGLTGEIQGVGIPAPATPVITVTEPPDEIQDPSLILLELLGFAAKF